MSFFVYDWLPPKSELHSRSPERISFDDIVRAWHPYKLYSDEVFNVLFKNLAKNSNAFGEHLLYEVIRTNANRFLATYQDFDDLDKSIVVGNIANNVLKNVPDFVTTPSSQVLRCRASYFSFLFRCKANSRYDEKRGRDNSRNDEKRGKDDSGESEDNDASKEAPEVKDEPKDTQDKRAVNLEPHLTFLSDPKQDVESAILFRNQFIDMVSYLCKLDFPPEAKMTYLAETAELAYGEKKNRSHKPVINEFKGKKLSEVFSSLTAYLDSKMETGNLPKDIYKPLQDQIARCNRVYAMDHIEMSDWARKIEKALKERDPGKG